MRNPFIFGRPVTGSNFINRDAELSEFLKILNSDNNIILSSRRQTGKTSLLLKLKDKLVKRGQNVIYLDLFLVKGVEEFLEYLATETARAVKGPVNKLASWVSTAIKSVRPVLVYDEKGGISVSLNIQQRRIEESVLFKEVIDLPQQMKYMTNKRKNIVVILDEFQRIYEIGGVQLENKLRAIMQHHTGINYLFAGSNRTLIHEAFNDRNKPFYEWGVQKTIGPLEREEFRNYIRAAFSKRKIKLPAGILDEIHDLCDDVPNHLQMFLFYIWNLVNDKMKITTEHLEQTVEAILSNNNQLYEGIIANLSEMQIRLLKGIARMGGSNITSDDFLVRNRLNSSANAVACRKALLKKNFVEIESKALYIRDPFFKIWLMRIP